MSVVGGVLGSTEGAVLGATGSISAPPVVVATICPSVQAALNRLITQFQGKPNIAALLQTMAEPACALEDAYQALLTKRGVNTATGVQLDRLGGIVGQPRSGLSDDTYRRYLRARILANRSTGALEDLIAISRVVVNDPAVKVHAYPDGIAALEVSLEAAVTAAGVPDVLISFLRAAVAAGVRVLLRALTESPDTTMTLARFTTATGTPTAGDSSIAVATTAGFPDYGQLDVDFGLAMADVVTYTARLANTFLGVTGLSHNHATSCSITRRGAPGKGLGAYADATLGGALARVLQ